jgi:hypothetical protein
MLASWHAALQCATGFDQLTDTNIGLLKYVIVAVLLLRDSCFRLAAADLILSLNNVKAFIWFGCGHSGLKTQPE